MDEHHNLQQQLDHLLSTLSSVPETEKPGNAAYYLAKLARYVINRGVDYPMVTAIWVHEDLEEVAEENISEDKASKLFAHIDRTHNAEIGINWDVLDMTLYMDDKN
ncbi:MAG: hypothetical protein JG718_14265 [Candidatus Thiothrix moscowensis]|nr:hypothetical protein [Candidatus Thiothrix moscowensis]